MLKTKEEIIAWLKEYRIINYHINDDLTVDVLGNVVLSRRNLKEIPVQFNHVDGDFNCTENYLKSLRGCPIIVEGNFICPHNKLSSLEYAPKEVGGIFYCFKNELTSLKGCPEIINGPFNIQENKLKTLEYGPKYVDGTYECDNNQLTTLRHIGDCNIEGDITYGRNQLPFSNFLSFDEIKAIYQKEDILNKTNGLIDNKSKKLKL